MLNKNNILFYIKNSKFLDEDFRKYLLNNFDYLLQEEQTFLINYFNIQRKEILKELVWLKNKNICSFENIKDKINVINRNVIKKLEEIENNKKDEELFNLLEQLS